MQFVNFDCGISFYVGLQVLCLGSAGRCWRVDDFCAVLYC